MSLLTVERNSPSPQESDTEETLSSSSHEGFVAREHYVTSLPPRPWASLGRHGGEQLRIFTHLKKVIKLLRNSDAIKLAVELENSWPRKVTKHLMLVATNGYQDTEETIVLGTEQEDSIVRVGLVLPLWRDTEIKLDGDGGFIVHSGDHQAVFKPSSVQSMWTTLQSLYQSTENARLNNYYVGGLSHTWMSYYLAQLTDDYLIRNEWNLLKDVESFRPDSPIYSSNISSTKAGNVFEKQLVAKLRGVMLHEDLEEVTSRQLREKLEKEMDMGLTEYREFLDRHMLRILGQLEQPSKILDYLYLGSEWNASNLSELKAFGVGYILNVTREIDNFYPEVFKYLNIRLYDVPDSELIKHWEKTYRFIKEAKMRDTKVLVHCKMGISRSSATVIAYMMKEYQMPLADAKKHVKSIRGCINPNDGFMSQLHSYEGILTARHNPRWGRHAPTRLYSKRSISDPDIMQSLEKEELERRGLRKRAEERGAEGGMGEEWEGEDGEESLFRPIHIVASAYNIPQLVLQQQMVVDEPELTFLAEGEVTGVQLNQQDTSGNSGILGGAGSLPERGALVHSTPVNKSRNLQHFLASLPVVIGSTDDGIGDNIPTSNSGSAYSSPIYTPPDEENIHMHMAAQHREQEVAGEAGTGALESSGDTTTEDRGRVADKGLYGQRISEPQPLPPSSSSSPRLSPNPPTYNISPPSGREQLVEYAGVINSPVSHSHRSYSLPYSLSGYVLRAEGSSTTTAAAAATAKNLSPTNGRGLRVSGLVRQSPAAVTPEDAEEGEARRRQTSPSTGTPLQGDLREVQSEEEAVERRGDDPLGNMTPRTREKFIHHRRTKSDSHHDISGPIKTTQISSVPERVKEIEEKGLQVTSTQSLQSIVPLADSQPLSATSSNSQSSSEECLASPLTDTGTGGRGKASTLQHAPCSSRVAADSTVRHSSLSPRLSLSPCRSSSPHLPVQTSFSLPSSVPSPDTDSGSSPPPSHPADPALPTSLHGVVKAKIKDIEGKKGPGQTSTGAQAEPPRASGSDGVVKRSLVQSGQRPQSEIIFHSPYVGVVEVNDPSDSETSTTSPTRELDGGSFGSAGSSSAFQTHRGTFSNVRSRQEGGRKARRMERRNTASDIFSSSSEENQDSRGGKVVQSGAVFSAWVGIIPREELQDNDLASVLELRQKFERRSPKDLGRKLQMLSSLRRSHSLRDTRLPSPPIRLGGSARWKRFLSNARLPRHGERHRRVFASASPTASGSQQSLTSSGK